MADLIITERSNIVALANTARNKTGQTKELTFGEIFDTFENAEIAKNQDITITENGTYTADDGYTGFGTVKVETEVAKNQNITIKENGTYTPPSGFTGFGSVKVDVESSGGSGGSMFVTSAVGFIPDISRGYANSTLTIDFETSAVGAIA
jgi:hypothetical protein